MRLTEAQRIALDRARDHPRHVVDADPRTIRSLLAKSLITVGYYGEGMDGPIYKMFLMPGANPS